MNSGPRAYSQQTEKSFVWSTASLCMGVCMCGRVLVHWCIEVGEGAENAICLSVTVQCGVMCVREV